MEIGILGSGNVGGALGQSWAKKRQDLSGLQIGHTTSAAEQFANWASGAKVVKVFNTTGANNMGNSRYPEGAPVTFYCGDDVGAKKAAAQLASDLGFEPIDAGKLTSARLLEPLAMLWIHLACGEGLGRDFAFRVMRR